MTTIIPRKNIALLIPDLLSSRKEILTFVPFSGSEKTCWDCGGERQVLIKTDLDGKLIEYKEVCDK